MPLAQPSGGLEELVDETSGKEIVATPVIVDRFADLKKKYEQFLGLDYSRTIWTEKNVPEIVLPCDINIFLQQTREYEDHANYLSTGFFVSQLIQNSYDAGNNNFELDVNALKPIDNLVSSVSGTKERVVRVVIKGETGIFCGFGAQHSIFTIKKAGDWYACKVNYSTFIIEKAGESCGFEAQNSIFKNHNPLRYQRFKISVPQNSGNSLYLLSDTGSIIQGGKF